MDKVYNGFVIRGFGGDNLPQEKRKILIYSELVCI